MTTERDHREIPTSLASTVASHHIFDPYKDRLVDVSIISTGMLLPMTKLKAFTTQISTVIDQIRARQEWYLEQTEKRRTIKREWVVMNEDKGKPENEQRYHWVITDNSSDAQRKLAIDAAMTELKNNDTLDVDTLFISQLLEAYCHTSRGKNGYLLSKGVDISISDIETRNPDALNEPIAPRRQ